MIRPQFVLILASVIAACSDPVTANGSCVAVVNIHGVMFGTPGDSPAPATVSSEVYLTITRNTGCLDQGQTADPLAHGESNFLPVGTTLHRIEGFGADERLAVWGDVLDKWRTLASHPVF